MPESNQITSTGPSICASDDDNDDDFFSECFAIEANTINNGVESTRDCASAETDDADGERMETITFSAIRKFQAAYRGAAYPVHYLDLSEEEFELFKLWDLIQYSIPIAAKPCDIFIENGTLSINRLSVPPRQHDDCELELSKTDRIYFSECEPLLAEYEQHFFFVHESLANEYKLLLQCTKQPMGTTLRVKRNQIVANRAENVLNVLESNVRLCANPAVHEISTGETGTEIDKVVLDEKWKRYIVNSDNELVVVESSLLIGAIDKEIDASYDIVQECSMQTSEDAAECLMIDNVVENTEDDTQSETSSTSTESEQIVALKMCPLAKYHVSDPVSRLIRGFDDIETEMLSEKIRVQTLQKVLLSKTMPENYRDIATCMIDLEDETEAVFCEQFDQSNIKLNLYMNNVIYFEIEKHHAELAAAIEEKYVDFVTLTAETETWKKKSFDGQFHRKHGGKIYIRLFDGTDKVNPNCTYTLECRSNRFTFQVTKRCLKICAHAKLIPLLLYNPRFHEREKLEPLKDKKPFTGTLARNLNKEQKSVVTNIMQRRSYPLPFVLFGPPGTGKTRTLVAAIEEIVKTTDQYVLVCATSNSACDEIAERLLDVLNVDENEYYMFRMFAQSIPIERVCPRLKRVSNVNTGKHFNPALSILYRYRVILTTLCTSSCFSRAVVDKEHYDPKHFSYIFVDECSSAPEVLTLVPIAGVCTTVQKVEAQIVLAGDPRQLGPVIRNRKASRLGYAISYIDRLMGCELYKEDRRTGKYNQKYIVQLVKNYRSHKDILCVPNELFYKGNLVATASADITNRFIGHPLLRNKEFPIIFDSIEGACESLPGECSCFNLAEIDKVLDYVKKLIPNRTHHNVNGFQINAEEIGIVTPYRKQCQKIRERLKYLGFPEVVVGSAEVFQGKEKPVMIVSTVRSGGIDLGFVSDSRRLNVMITRAKSLMIIVGNAKILAINKNWKKLIDFCYKSGAVILNKNMSI